ncbi:UDP-N-acetylmuramate dehydrogenase [Pleomorphovibrio marinus]|uniref:UDP-N-acetylmuramate dehydrogenase n=1 Tax=Pleomorphovibrio marinus TaxID=2164132 RepID=UPI000E09E3C5|nr:UDP-N-acetylmuramate dehydrogenase [Pleomorphovibrio marinus]
MKVFPHFDLTEYNSYKIQSHCRQAVFPESEQDLIEVYQKHGENIVLLGSGHNVILSKPYYEETFVIFNGNFSKVEVDESSASLEAESGASMLALSELALEHGLSGLEIFYDIPSSLGGAVVMNAGASGEEIKDVLVRVRYLDLEDMQIKTIEKSEIGFEYRNSFFQRNRDKLVLSTLLQLKKGNRDCIREKMETIKAQRWAKQPKDFPNAGSVFKRPKGYFVGAIMDELKLKGYTVGGAKVSEKHGGFIINHDNAQGKDILGIIDHVQQKVKERYGFFLEVEQRVI